ncbi:unnamed protein product, partial [marine sediment metagenome]
EEDKLVLLVTKMIREDFLMQSAYHEIDTYCLPLKAQMMLGTIIKFYGLTQKMLDSGVTVAEIRSSPMVPRIARMKDIPNEDIESKIKQLWAEMETSLVAQKGGAA